MLRQLNVMKKTDLIDAIAHKTGISKVEITAVLDAEIEAIMSSLAEGDNVYLRGFGSFVIQERKEKLARNIRNNTTMLVPAHCFPKFKPSPEFTNKLN